MTTNRPPQSSPAAAIFFQLTLAIVVSLTLVRLISISERYPYYFMWDLDHVVDLDTLLINSEMLPDNFGHPGFGMYLLLTTSERAAHAIGTLSFTTLHDVDAALNPIGGMAELTDFLRRHSPFVCVAIVLALWTALRLRFVLPWWLDLLCLLLLASPESLSYHASMIRGELYSVLFWSLSMLAAAAVASSRRHAARDLGHVLIGVMLGLAFLTKVQAFFYVATTICVVLLFRSLADEDAGVEHLPNAMPERGRLVVLAMTTVAGIVFFLGVSAAAVRTHIPTGVATWATHQGVTPVAVAVGLLMAGLLAVHALALSRREVPLDAMRYAIPLTTITAGFLLAFALHLVVFADLSTSWLYLVYDFKIVFMRQAFFDQSVPLFVGTVAGFIGHNPWPYLCHLTLLTALIGGGWFGTIRLRRDQRLWIAAASLITFINLGLGTRFILRDAIWAETVVNFLSLVYLAILVSRAAHHRRLLISIGASFAAITVAGNVVRSAEMTRRVEANYNWYGWQPEKWAQEVYGYNQLRYSEIIAHKYDEQNLRIALRAGVDHRALRDDAAFVLPSQRPDHRNIGIAAVNMPVWVRQERYSIAAVPEDLSGAMVIDASAAVNRGWPLYHPEMVRRWSEYLDKFRTSRSTNVLPVMTRPDLRILLFVAARDVAEFMSEFVTPTGEIITLQSGGETMEMIGLEVKNYSEIPFTDQPGRYFFVVARR